jgi:hypothetical protein
MSFIDLRREKEGPELPGFADESVCQLAQSSQARRPQLKKQQFRVEGSLTQLESRSK